MPGNANDNALTQVHSPPARDFNAMQSRLSAMSVEVKKWKECVVVHHHDADGISAGSIAVQALLRKGIAVKHKAIKQLYREDFEMLLALGENFVFVDFGSGQLSDLKKHFPENFLVLDHHAPQEDESGRIVEHAFHANPLLFGFDGGNELSGAGMAYIFAKTLDANNNDLAALAVVGAVGDMQDLASGKLVGLNSEIVLKDAVEAGVLGVKNDLRLYGRISRPLVQMLLFSTSPVLPDLTAREENCKSFLHGAGITLSDEHNAFRSYEDLAIEEKKRLSTALVLHMNSFNVPEWKIQELFGEVYTLLHEGRKSPLRDAKEFSTLLNAVGRHGEPDLGLAVCLGNREEAYGNALALLAEHRRQLAQGIELVSGNGLQEFESFYFFDAGEKIRDSIVGIVAGMLYSSGIIGTDRPIIAMARYDDGTIKVSARATKDLVRKGLHLGKALRSVCDKLGGIAEGGGHAIAAGCKIGENEKERFLELMNEEVKNYLRG
ncbi:MAG: DHH family phosphoesterase [Candidatus Diapherotrites archaeon]|nr:DHH family phosphoesterase [Candidatus Diapherotrites archaeon]